MDWSPPQPGRVVGGRYRLETSMGTGGVGAIWRATQTALDRAVAVKFLTPEALTEELVARFLREARAAAAIRHRNVVSVIDLGMDDGGTPYLVMELLEGETLDERLSREPRATVGEVIDLMVEVLAGLAAVHDAGVIHRDIKPQNIFLTEGPDGTVPKIVDFGVSRISAALGTGQDVAVTSSGQMIGTPLYMSPEQIRCRKDIDGRADLYGLAMVVYEALSGQHPYRDDSLAEVILAIATEPVTPLREVRPELGEGLSQILERGMAKLREERFDSAADMRDTLLELSAEGSFRDLPAGAR